MHLQVIFPYGKRGSFQLFTQLFVIIGSGYDNAVCPFADTQLLNKPVPVDTCKRSDLLRSIFIIHFLRISHFYGRIGSACQRFFQVIYSLGFSLRICDAGIFKLGSQVTDICCLDVLALFIRFEIIIFGRQPETILAELHNVIVHILLVSEDIAAEHALYTLPVVPGEEGEYLVIAAEGINFVQ